MNKLIIILFLSLSTFALCQDNSDDVTMRIYNDSKYHLTTVAITIDGDEYLIENTPKKQYSDYISLPYLWSINNVSSIKYEKKRFLRKPISFVSEIYPIDHIGDEKYVKGQYTLVLRIDNSTREEKVYESREGKKR